MRLYAYNRVSTLTQLEGGGLQIQKQAIERYCELQGHEIVKFYTDKGVSGAKFRPELEKALKQVGDVDGIIVHDLTRFGRSTLDLLQKIHQLEDNSKTFISVKENIDLSTKVGRLLLTTLSAIAEFERETIREKMTAGQEYAKEHGTKSGKPMHRPQRVIDWTEVDKWLGKGLSLGAISKIIGVSRGTMYNRHKARQPG